MLRIIFINYTIAFLISGYAHNAFSSSEACSYSNSSQKNPELVIYYDANKLNRFPISQVDDALKFYFSKKQVHQPLLLFVHGRALENANIGDYDKEPEKSRTKVFPALSEITKTVLMLHWPHRQVANGFPEADARFAAKSLICVLQKLNSDTFNVNKYPGFRALITQSMGALVLEEAIKTHSEINLSEFDVIAIFAAASKAVDANLWLPKITAKNRYVFINTHDYVLKKASSRINNILLGICDVDCFINNTPVQSITYLDISNIAGKPFNKKHNYFVKGEVAKKIVSKILKGESLPQGSHFEGIPTNVRKIRDQDIK